MPVKQLQTTLGYVRVIDLQKEIPTGWRALTIQQGKKIKQELYPALGLYSIIAFKTGKIDGQDYGNNIFQEHGPQCGEIFIIKNQTPLGMVVKCGLDDSTPAGFRRLTLSEGLEIKSYLNQALDQWSIVAFDQGKIDGIGYGNTIDEAFGGQCGEAFFIYCAPYQESDQKKYVGDFY